MADAASQSQWTVFMRVPESCHRYASADEAIAKHFTDTGNYRERWPNHFYWHYLYPETDIDVVPHDFTVYVPRQPRTESERDIHQPGDTFNDHFHVLEDPSRGLLYAFWTQATREADIDQHIAFSKSVDKGVTWTPPVVLAGSPNKKNPALLASWQQPMLAKSGRLY